MREWKPISDYKGFYEVSSLGEIKSLRTNQILKPCITQKGYLNVSLSKNGIVLSARIHRIVAKEFCSNPMGYAEVNHIDGDKRNNNSSNLEWCTRSMNVKHAFDNGHRKPVKGSRVGLSKLKESDVSKIRALSKTKTQREIASIFDVNHTTIGSILRGQTWTHVL